MDSAHNDSTLFETLCQLSGASPETIRQLYQHFTCRHLDKGQWLLSPDSICTAYYLIESGTLRLYYVQDERDYTVWMGTTGQVFTELYSYLHNCPTPIGIQALTPSIVYTIAKPESDQLAAESMAYNTILRRSVEEAFASMSRHVMGFQSLDAQSRYLRLEQESNWLTRYPLKYLSSFLGMTQSTLSRLRAKRR